MFPEADDWLVVSLGTGELIQVIPYKDAKNWGMAGWARPILSVVFHGVSMTVHYEMEQMLPPRGADHRYYRFEPRLDTPNDDLDDTSPENLHAVIRLAEEMIATRSESLDSLCRQLVS